jgi:hypothetical protein
MPKRKPEPIWRIQETCSERAEFLGIISAPSAAAAVEKACTEFGIEDPKRCKRLVAQPIVKRPA